MKTTLVRHWLAYLGLAFLFLSVAKPAEAQLFRRRAQRVQTAIAPSQDPSVYPMLGTFYPANYTVVRGNYTGGGGYSPLNFSGGATMVIYGPLAATRAYSAPVRFTARGYNGGLYEVRGRTTSYPNLPSRGAVVYPNQGTYYWGPRQPSSSPRLQDGTNWIDMN